MVAYRFCRTDDIELLVAAYNRCVLPHFPDRERMTVPGFKHAIRELNLWCSSCMVATAKGEPAAVMLGTKREQQSAIHTIAVHPDHQREGYGRHLLRSIEQKLAILGPPRMVAEVPLELAGARAFFAAAGWRKEGRLVDLVFDGPPDDDPPAIAELASEITVDDLSLNGLLDDPPGIAWERSRQTLSNLREELSGLAIAGSDRIEAFFLARPFADGRSIEVVRLGHAPDGDGARMLRVLLAHERRRTGRALQVPKLSSSEMKSSTLESWGFRRVGEHDYYATEARARHE